MSGNNKRHAQSPLSGDEEDLKSRIIMEEVPNLVALDELPDSEDQATADNGGSALLAILEGEGKTNTQSEKASSDKVDRLIDRMDRFMECFANLHSTVSRNQSSNQQNFKRLEAAHNDMVNKVVKSAESTESRLESLEAKLEESLAANEKLVDKVTNLENEQDRRFKIQRQINDDSSKTINSLEIEQGYTNRYLHDCRSETKERKMIISGIPESSGENVKMTALNKINKVIEAVLALKNPDHDLTGVRKLKVRDIDNVYRIGKNPSGSRKRNISVTFLSVDDREMVINAKSNLKDDQSIKYFFNEDVSIDGRALKTRLKHIAQVANSLGFTAKATGNKVTINSRAYFSNELHLIPAEVSDGLKQEREIDGGIIYKGE